MPTRRFDGLTATLQNANGSPLYKGVIASSGSATSNSSTAAPFTLDKGEWVLLQPDADGYIGVGKDSASALTAASSTNGLRLLAGEKYAFLLLTSDAYVGYTPVSGTGNLKVFTQG